MDLQQLSDVWEIQKLKSRYFRCMDLRLWDEFRDVFTDDLELYIENTKTPQAQTPTIRGADALVVYLSASDPRKVTIHQGHMPEIEFIDADHATGIWAMFDWVDDPGRGFAGQGFGHYHERYVRCPDGRWRISSVRLTRLRVNKVPHLESDQQISLDPETVAAVAHRQRPSGAHRDLEEPAFGAEGEERGAEVDAARPRQLHIPIQRSRAWVGLGTSLRRRPGSQTTLSSRRRSHPLRPNTAVCHGAGSSSCRLPARSNGSGVDCTGVPMKNRSTLT